MILMDTQAVKPTYQDAFMVAFGEPEGESVNTGITEKEFFDTIKPLGQTKKEKITDEIRTLLQHGHRRKNILIRLLVKWALRKPPPVTVNIYFGKISYLIKQIIIFYFCDYSFSLYFCWFNVTGKERWEAKPDYNLTYDGYDRDSISYKKEDMDRGKAVEIMDKILDIMEPLVDKQLPKTRLNCWMNADNIKIEITNE